MAAVSEQTKDLVIERIFDAPREQVWRAWTDPELFMRWWGPSTFTSPTCRMDVRPGGRYVWSMRDPDGNDYYSAGTFLEVTPPERLVYTDSFADKDGNIIPPSAYGMSDAFPTELTVTVTLEDLGQRTKMRTTFSGMPEGPEKEMTAAGFNESLDKLTNAVTKQVQLTIDREKLQIIIIRDFDAPAALVWRALTEPTLLSQWWGQPGSPMSVDKHELRPGGEWRFVERDAAGNEYGFRGVFREIESPRRIVQTFEYEPMAGHVIVETLTLTEHGGGTKLTAVEQFDNIEDLEGMYQSGMEDGTEKSYNQLAALLQKMA
jgi:uncharacterized protein YndB with AHSA1/START domain